MATADKKRAGLSSKMGRPSSFPMNGFAPSLLSFIKKMRNSHPGWGAITILSELVKDARWSGIALPSSRTIGRYLKHLELTQVYEKHSDLPVEVCKKAKRCHSLWQIDGQGNTQVGGIGPIAMLNIKDVHSSTYVASFPARMDTERGHPDTSDYQTAMRLGFLHHGMPRKVQSDHASVFYDNRSKSPFPTTFCLWLVSLGIRLCYSRFHRPTDQGQVERAHQTVFNQVLRGRNDYTKWEQLFDYCEQRRKCLNEDIPSSSTDHQPPLIKYPEAKHSGRDYHPQKEAQMINLKRVFVFLSKGKWYRKVAANKTVSLGRQIYYLSKAKPKEQLKITFCKKQQKLLFQNDKELIIDSMDLKGIDQYTLMGKMPREACFPNFQLQLPLFWETQKVNTTF